MDIYEALTAAVYLMSSASNPLKVSRESRRLSFEQGAWVHMGRTQTVEDMVESGFFYLQLFGGRSCTWRRAAASAGRCCKKLQQHQSWGFLREATSSSEVSGILEVSGPLVFKEYFGRPEDTAKEFTEDGWFRTGDSAACDLGGSFRILGRTSVDIIKSGGYKISALEVEAAFFGHPALIECAVVAVPDDTWGERLVLVVVPAPGQPQADLAGLQTWAAQRLAKYKWPRELRILDSLPRNAMGKVNKKQLKLMAAHQQSLCLALDAVSTTLSSRLSPLARSDSVMDIYEALTAAVYLMSSASNPLKVSRESRRLSFEQGAWVHMGRTQTVEDMVESGFFYLQEDDHVKCFFCDLGLKDWDAGDVPEMEHAKFSPLCFFLKSSRGLEWLRRSSPRPPNYPTSYTRQDHNQLLRILSDELLSEPVDIVCKLGFCDTKVLLCIARKFIRFRQKFTRQELLQE
uniref:AMP-binding domain-containing protein n=1 Tax=Macrostomum lignano TaxID=282301 RepID=A0A1I8J0T0_9PLAT